MNLENETIDIKHSVLRSIFEPIGPSHCTAFQSMVFLIPVPFPKALSMQGSF